jgi:hypothetical protein
MMCAIYGCDVEATAEAMLPSSRSLRVIALRRRERGIGRFTGSVGISKAIPFHYLIQEHAEEPCRAKVYPLAMTRAITPEQFVEALPTIVNSMGEHSFVIERDGEVLAALVTPEEYKLIRQVRGRQALSALNRLSDAIEASGASEEELKDLEKSPGRIA